MAKHELKLSSVYAGHSIILITKHAKLTAIGPVFREKLGANVLAYEVDTDQLGTFSGEIERKGSALESARRKCEWSLEHTGKKIDFTLASEGSFGPHPLFPYAPCDHEILYFIDRKHGFHLHLSHFSEKTNYNMEVLDSFEALQKFAQTARFPSHALILRPADKERKTPIFKGINSQVELEKSFIEMKKYSREGKVWIETDMRANFNPSRMKVIKELAVKLAERLVTHCPSCNTPGWGYVGNQKGLHCEYCHRETQMISHEILGCVLCDYQQICPRSDSIKMAPQMYCNWCNP